MPRSLLALTLSMIALAACGDSRERGPEGDAGPAACRGVESFVEGAPCSFTGQCVTSDGCCETAWRCMDARLITATRCGVPGCFTTCDDALASGAPGDPCEGAYFCSRFDDRLCCERAVECVGGRLAVDEACGAGCATE